MVKKLPESAKIRNLDDLDRETGFSCRESMTKDELKSALYMTHSTCSVLFERNEKLEQDNLDYQADVSRLNKDLKKYSRENQNLKEENKALKEECRKMQEKLEGAQEQNRLHDLHLTSSRSEKGLTGHPTEAAEPDLPEPGDCDPRQRAAVNPQTPQNKSVLPTKPGTSPRSEKGKASKKGIPKRNRLRNYAAPQEQALYEFPENFFEDHPNFVPIDEECWITLEYVPGYIKRVYHHLSRAKKTGYLDPAEAEKNIPNEFDPHDELDPGEIIAAKNCRPLAERSQASASLLAYFFYTKFVMFTPYHRLSAGLERDGIPISKQLIGRWTNLACTLLEPLYWVIWQDLRALFCLQADETPVLCLEELQTAGRKKCWMMQFLSGPKEPLQIQYYIFRSSREQVFIPEVLDRNRKYCLQSDAFPGYLGWDFIINFGCFDHARRPFAQSLQAMAGYGDYCRILKEYGLNSPEMEELLERPGNRQMKDCVYIVDGFSVMYHNERVWKTQNFTESQIQENRKRYSEPILEGIYEIAEKYTTKVDGRGRPEEGKIYTSSTMKFGKGISYLKNQKKNIGNLMNTGSFQLGNTRCERGMKPVKLIENNSFFYDTAAGAEKAAVILTLFQTCSLNNVLQRQWMEYALKEMSCLPIIPGTKPEELSEEVIGKIRGLLPYSPSLPEELRIKKAR